MDIKINGPEYTWLWVSPDGRIKHTYRPKTSVVFGFYLNRGWRITYRMKGEVQ